MRKTKQYKLNKEQKLEAKLRAINTEHMDACMLAATQPTEENRKAMRKIDDKYSKLREEYEQLVAINRLLHRTGVQSL